MATAAKNKPASRAAKPSTAVAKVARAQVALPPDAKERMLADAAAFNQRMAAPSGNRIAVTQDRKFRDPSTGEKHDTFRGVIVDFVSKKSWYVFPYDKDNIVPPNCFAIGFEPHNNLVPSENSPDVQCESCHGCAKNAFKSAENGKGKACKDSYILAILSPDGEGELKTLELSATALSEFNKYVRDVQRNFGVPPYGVITEFYMDDKVDYASVRCGSPEDISGTELMAIAMGKREEAEQLLRKEPEVADFDEKVRSRMNAPKKAAGRAAARR